LRSINCTALSLRGFLLLSSLIMVMVMPILAAGQDAPDIQELQRQIDANGWKFEVDDHFTSTLTPEVRANLRGYNPPADYERELKQHLKIYPIDKDELPSSLDWRDLDGITSVKSQGSCGSCWAFAATAEMEAFIKIYYGKETDLSEQQSISCNPYGSGCGGGFSLASYYVFQHYGVVLENCAPYLAMDPPGAPCTQDDFLKYGTITGYNHISNDVLQIKTALQYGPVCTSVDAGPAFEAYAGGCYDVPGGSTNHLVLIVGYDDRLCGSNGAWIIKNSWGTDFGVGGYITVQYGAGSVGTNVTQLVYAEPPVSVVINEALDPLYGDQTVDIHWTTAGDPVSMVDIWLGVDGNCHDILVEENVPNTGTYTWMVPNLGTDFASLVIFPSSGIENGYDFTETPLKIIGHKTRYVSPSGSDTPPYETSATAAHTIADAVLACTGTDTVLVEGGDYLSSVTVNTTVKIRGSWDPTFSVQDMLVHPTRMQGGSSSLRFRQGSGDYGSVEEVVFHNCYAGTSTLPENGEHGGAIYSLEASPTIRNCVFENNQAGFDTGTGFGGAICFIDGMSIVENCEFTGNIASAGGAVGMFGTAVVTFTDCTFTGNQSDDGGGAIKANGGSLELRNTTLLDNQGGGGNGGGVDATDTHFVFRNTRISGNTVANMGGGICAFSATGVVENCQIDGNVGASIGGIFVLSAGDFQVRNTMVVGNDSGGMLISGTGATEDWNNIWGNIGGDNMSSTPGANDLSLDPLFVDAVAGDFGLACYSPCIDGGEIDPLCMDPDGSRADIGMLGGPNADFVAPAAVAGLVLADLGGGQIRLTWDPGSEPDLDFYVIYRDSAEVFIPTPAKALASVPHPTVSFDDTPPTGDWYYLVAAVNEGGYGGGYSEKVHTSGGASAVDDALPQIIAIARIAPNPFNPRTTIHFDVARSGPVRLGIFDVRGHLVQDLVTGTLAPGRHQAVWDGRDRNGRAAAAGIYFVRMTGEGKALTAKMVLAK
jgi:predicted outer membrane repeat protein